MSDDVQSSFQVRKELEDLRDKLQPLQMKYHKEKERIDEIRKLKQRREDMLFSLQEAERRMDLARVADIKYGALLEVDAAIAKLEGETGENLILTETVGPEQIAEVRLLEAKLVALPFSSSMCITVSLY
jgi:ATP-dependent Clp protease ATP-binding subunit ClpB